MKLYNTLTKKLEDFIPYNEDFVTMYTCGPTVYNYAHIGNLRTYISEDLLEKTLIYLGYNVKRCMNITDVGHLVSDGDSGEDKMSVASKRENKSIYDIAKFYTDAFFMDLEKLNIKKPEIISKATDNIDVYIKIISKLIDEDYAYISNGNVYFDTSKFPNYFELSNRNLDEQIVGVRDDVDLDDAKRNVNDFGLWFTNSKFMNQDMKWDSPWGVGYPGWHIECSGISINNLGEYLDIHCGAVDAIFPHHTNEIAQSEAFLGHKWCKYWVHMEFLNNKDGKMSKSKGNFLTLKSLEDDGFSPLIFRFMCLNSHYRSQMVFSYDILNHNKEIYNKLKRRVLNIKNDGEFNEYIFNAYNNKFMDCLANDLNSSNALSIIYEVLKDKNINGSTKKIIIESFDKVLSLDLFKEDIDNNIDKEFIEKKILERKEAKEAKDYIKADQIRDELLKLGVYLIDTKDGCKYEIR